MSFIILCHLSCRLYHQVLALICVGIWIWLCVCVFSLVYFMREISVCLGGCLFICLAQLYEGLVTKNRITGSIINKLPTALLGKLMRLKPERLGCNTKHMGSFENSELQSLLLILKL